MKKLLALALTLILAVGLLACASPAATQADNVNPAAPETAPEEKTDPAEPEADKTFVVGLAMKSVKTPFFLTIADRIEELCAENNWKCISLAGDDDISKERENMDSLIASNVDLIIMDPVDCNASITAVKAAFDAGIPVICVDNSLEAPEYIVSMIYADNTACGLGVGKYMGEKYFKDTPAYIAVDSCVQGNEVCYERIRTVVAGIYTVKQGLNDDEAYKKASDLYLQLQTSGNALDEEAGIHLLGETFANLDSTSGIRFAEDMMVAHNNINLMIGINDAATHALMQGVQNSGYGDQVFFCSAADGEKDTIAEIRDGQTQYKAIGTNSPFDIATLAVDIASEILEGGKDPYSYEKVITTEAVIVTQENAAEYYRADSAF